MSVSLFSHNDKAYKAAVVMLKETGKAAVIHPTGTGKSFIGFKLCEDNPDAKICWLSPSEYIFRTQLENLKSAADGYVPENVSFYTYSKLTFMTDNELDEIDPDYIILDEFHRCGAEIWGGRVTKLLEVSEKAAVLGLSATNIRYLDNKRNMADELFDGNVASEITLGEAIVRGILKAPVYISTVYSYQKELEKYQRRIKSSRYASVKDKAQKFIDELKRVLEKADGLDKIFSDYITDKNGKYIVFCSSKEHIDSLKPHIDEWFYAIDKRPHIYTVYSDNPEASSDFSDFCNDDSEHLKLLFCIDMLNEGIHLDDISGVILFRPTVSPIIYKQQIGRALTAGKNSVPIIFDIINNFDNLYSIGAIEHEMECAVAYYNSLGEKDSISVDRFEVIGIAEECVKLFNQLNNVLSASWDEMYGYAKRYYSENGNLEIPKRYKTENNISLGNWLETQRRVRCGKAYGIITEEQIKKLDDIGMRWQSFSDMNWEKNYTEAVKYSEEHGLFNPPSLYVSDNGIKLGVWASNLRTYRKSGIHTAYLTPERVEMLDRLGMVWDVPDYIFEKNYSAALAYYRENGNLDVPHKYISDDGVRLGVWIRNIRTACNKNSTTLTSEQINRLNEIGMLWDDKYSRDWENGFRHAEEYYLKNKNLNVPATYVCKDGFALGKWIDRNRAVKGGIRTTEERKARLDSIGMIWHKADPWEVRFSLVKKYYEENGNIDIPASYKADGIWIAKWLDEQRQICKGKRGNKQLTDNQLERLKSLGFSIYSKNEKIWFENYLELKKRHSGSGQFDNSKLENWCTVQRRNYKKGKLTDEQVALLSQVNFAF